MKKCISYAALAVLGFLVLCFTMPGDRGDRRAAALCSDGRRLVSVAGATEDEARRLACDHKAAQDSDKIDAAVRAMVR